MANIVAYVVKKKLCHHTNDLKALQISKKSSKLANERSFGRSCLMKKNARKKSR